MKRYPQNLRGFVIAPVLYILGLIGVLGGILFSNNMQVLRGNMAVQNGLTVRSDLQAAASTLSAQAVLGTDSQTLCPPRSAHQTSGDVCASAPVSLIQFSDFGNASRLPTNYANAAMSGSPVEVGVFAAGAGVKQLAPYGHAYVYCRWENPRSNPAATAFTILSAGADGILQTRCGDSTPQGDDMMTTLTVGVAINRASLWQADTSNGVSYGAAGSKVTIDDNGNLTAAGVINALSAAIADGITAATVTTTGDMTTKDLVASGSVFGSTGSFVSLGASSAAITGGVTAATLTTSGDISGEDLSVSGAVSGTTGVFISFNASNAAIANGLTAASLTASGAVTGATGAFASLSVTNAAAITGNATVGGTLTVTGATHGSSATYSGTVTAASFNGAFSGSYSGSTLTTTGAASVNSLAVSNNATIGGTLGVSGYATLAGVTASGITDTGTLSVAGTTSLAGLSATSLSLGGNASMYGNIGVGCAANSNLAFVVCQNTAYDPIAFLAQYGSSDGIVGISAPTGYGAELVFDENTTDYWGIGKAEAQYGRGFYVWDFTNGKNIIYGNYPSGDLYLGESTSAYLTLTASGYAGFGAYPINPLDVSGGTAIGAGYAGQRTAPTNGVIVQGNVGIGTNAPAATLDIAGYMRLKKYSVAPATCGASIDGDIALTALYTLCVCKNGTGWVTASTGSTSCTW